MGALLKFELAKIVRSKLTYMGFVLIFCLVTLVYVGFQWRKHHPRKDHVAGFTVDSREMMNAPFFSLWVETPTVLFYIPMLVALMGSSLVAGESRAGTLRTMLIRPVSRTQVLGAKGMMALLYAMVLMGFTAAMALGIGFYEFKSRGNILVLSTESKTWFYMVMADQSLERTYLSYVLTVPMLVSVAMLGLMFSVIFESTATAAMATLGIYYGSLILDILPFSFMEVIHPFLPTHYMWSWRQVFYPRTTGGQMLWDRVDWERIGADLAWLGVFTAVYMTITMAVFLRKDVKS